MSGLLGDPLLNATIRSLPSIMTFLATVSGFYYSVLRKGLEKAHQLDLKLCSSFNEETSKPQKEGFRCFGPGLTGLSIWSSATSIAITIFIGAISSDLSPLKLGWGTIAAVVLLMGVVVFTFTYDAYSLGLRLQRTRYGKLHWLGRNIASVGSLGSVLCSYISYFIFLA